MATNTTTQIRKTVDKTWHVWRMFNDKRKNGTRRLKILGNTVTVTQQRKQDIQFAVMRDLQAQGIAILTIQWNVGEDFDSGIYDYLEIVF